MESSVCVALLLGLVLAPCSHAQGSVTSTTEGSTTLQPWLVGLTAVMVFLGVVFVAALINKSFCSKTKDNEKEDMMAFELGTSPRAFDNETLEIEEEGPVEGRAQKVVDEKLTTM